MQADLPLLAGSDVIARDRLHEAFRAMHAELKRLEWSECGGCPRCKAWQVGEPHKPGCTLRAALDKAEGAS